MVTPEHVRAAKAETYSVVTETKLKNLDSGATIDKTFRSGEKMERAILETKKNTARYGEYQSG